MVATLIAGDQIRKTDRILDCGCGKGTEALLLAKWGFGKVDGVDSDDKAIGVARGRAKKLRLEKRVRFHRGDASDLASLFPPDTFDVVLHTLVANNLDRADVERHFAGVHSVIKPGGLLVLQERVVKRYENARPDKIAPLRGAEKHFDLSAGIATHLPEGGVGGSAPAAARVFIWLGRPR